MMDADDRRVIATVLIAIIGFALLVLSIAAILGLAVKVFTLMS